MRVSIYLNDQTISTLQDRALAARRAPKAHLEWLIERTLQAPETGEEELRVRVERLERKLGQQAGAQT